MKILTLFAHPDDEALAAGGTLRFYRKRQTVVAIPFTGAMSRKESTRQTLHKLRKDCEKAMTLLGVDDVILGEFPDNQGDSFPRLDLFRWVEDVVERIRPTLILTHHYACTNIDHRLCYEAAIVATRPSVDCHIDVWCGEIPSSTGYLRPTNWEPNIYVGLSSQDIDHKIMAMNSYKEEVRPYPHPRSSDIIRAIAQVRGSESGFEYAEAFMAGRVLIR